MLFVPYTHVEHREQDGREANNWLGILFKAAHRYAGRIGGDYNLITSSGSAATQTVPHMHIHYVPRRADDGLHLPWTGQVSS
jgi:diadenosine tetraphosphate (Ap4A) HIT family hydrolase